MQPEKVCSVEGCGGKHYARTWCTKHYQRWLNTGLLEITQRAAGTGSITRKGYLTKCINGRIALEHHLVAEAALGKSLPKGAIVHHVDGNPLNNERSNLVICPDNAYHNLLHRRQRALEACGNADWRKCSFCGEYGPPEDILRRRHPHCHRTYFAEYQAKRREQQCSSM